MDFHTISRVVMATFKACNIADYETQAEKVLHPHTWNYYHAATGNRETYEDNRRVFERYRLRPRVLRGISGIVDTSTTILGHRITSPVCIAPTALHVSAHPKGEFETAKAASQTGIAMTLSSTATTDMRTLSSAFPDGLFFVQTYLLKNKNLMRLALQKAESSGFKAVVLTIDSVLRPSHKFNTKDSPYLMDILLKQENQIINCIFEDDEESYRAYKDGPASFIGYLMWQGIQDTPANFDIIGWVKSVVPSMSVVLKGILTGKAAREAVDNGADAVWVSNHGGRQLDSLPATLDVLPEVVDAVKGTNTEVFVDSGFRTGSDVFKALALGATAVFVGRPILWGLSVNGAEGVSDVLDILTKELRLCMALCGCQSLKDISRKYVCRESEYLNRPLFGDDANPTGVRSISE